VLLVEPNTFLEKPDSGSCESSSQLSFQPQLVGWCPSLVSRPRGQLAFCEPLKAWVVLGARDGATEGTRESTWLQDGYRVAAKLQQSEDQVQLICELEAEGISVVSGKTAALLHVQVKNILKSLSRHVAEAFHTAWRQAPWTRPPEYVRAALPHRSLLHISAIEELLAYKFSNPCLLAWALTHSSRQDVWASDVLNPHLVAPLGSLTC